MSVDLSYLDDIRDAITAPETADLEMVKAAAAEYNDACRESNRRLREVARLLRDGLRSEAIQVAEQEPPLLEFVAELDALLEDWQEMLADMGLELPPDLEIDMAAELNSAYAEILPLEQLLRKHRLLAIARAPLAARLTVLRQIAEKDNTNSSWRTDVESYEEARLREIKEELKEVKTGDVAALQQLRKELSESPWTCEIPKEISQEIDTAYALELKAAARRKLEELVPQLDRAYSEFDPEVATQLSEQWSKYLAAADLSSGDPLEDAAREALDWVEQQQQLLVEEEEFSNRLASLENALDRDTPREQLETLYHKVQRFERPVPDGVQQRITQRLDALTVQARRKGLLIGGLATVLVLAAASGIGAYWYSLHRQGVFTGQVAAVQKLVEQKKWQEALDYVKTFPVGTQQAPEIVKLAVQCRDALKTEHERALQVAELLDRAEAMDPAAPDLKLLAQLKKLLKLSEEKHRLNIIEGNVRRAKQQRQQDADERFLAMFNRWSTELGNLKESATWDNIDLSAMRASLQDDLDQHSDASQGIRQKGKSLTSKLNAMINEQKQYEAEQLATKAVFRAISRPDEYTNALKKLVETHPNTVAAKHAQQLLDEKSAWLAVMKWSQFWSQQQEWDKLSPFQAKQIIKEGETRGHETKENRLSLDFKARLPYLKKVADRRAVADATKNLKRTLIDNKFVQDVWLVILNGKSYYCPKKPDKTASGLNFEYFEDASNTEERGGVASQAEYVGVAPQTRMSKDLEVLMRELDYENWDTTFYRLATRVNKERKANPELDPILAMLMLRRIFETGCRGSYLFQEAFSPEVEKLAGSGVDLSAHWFNPTDSDAKSTRKAAEGALAGLKDFREQYRTARDKYGELCKLPTDRVKLVGAVNQKVNGGWSCESQLEQIGDGELLVAHLGNRGEVNLVEVGKVKGGEITWSTEKLLIGTPLFLQAG